MKPLRTGTASLLALAFAGCVLYAGSAHGSGEKSIRSLKAKQFEVPDSVGIKMIRVDAGSFTMGSPKHEPGRKADEAQRKVKINPHFPALRPGPTAVSGASR